MHVEMHMSNQLKSSIYTENIQTHHLLDMYNAVQVFENIF